MPKLVENLVSIPYFLREKENRVIASKDKEEVLTQFEALFIHLLLREMRRSLNLSRKSLAEDALIETLFGKVSEFVGKKGIGLRKEIMRHVKEDL